MNKEVRIQNIKYAPPPPELPVLGRVAPEDVSFIGRTNYVAGLEEKKFVFGIKRVDRKQHIYVIGKSGVGKSKFLELLIRQDISYGKGVCLLDPSGEIVSASLKAIPKERVNDVCIIDFSDVEHPASINLLANVDPMSRHQFAEDFVEALEKQFGSEWSPRLEHLGRCSILALLEFPNATLTGLVSLLTDASFRDSVLPYIGDAVVKRFWEKEFIEWSEKYEADVLIPFINKINQLFSHPIIKAIFSQTENKANFDSLIHNNKIIFINLSKDRIGINNANFFGSLFLSRVRQVGVTRASISGWAKDDFYLYIDEFEDFITSAFNQLLSESKKYGICLTMAHQYMEQLKPQTRATILGNVGTIVIFRVGGEDAEKLESEMNPVFKSKDMINLGVREFYIKMNIDGEAHDPFSADALEVLSFPERTDIDDVLHASHTQFSSNKGS